MPPHLILVLALAAQQPLPLPDVRADDLTWLPGREASWESSVAAGRARREAAIQQMLCPRAAPFWQALESDIALREQAWDALHWARVWEDCQEPAAAAAALCGLRARIGGSAYYGGRMPPPTPWWLYPEVP